MTMSLLHVAETVDCEVFRANGAPVPQLQLSCPESVRQRYDELSHAEIYPPCYSILSFLPKLTVHSWLSALQVERFEQKAHVIAARLERCNNHWEDVFFITLARNFGFGLIIHNSPLPRMYFTRCSSYISYTCIIFTN